MANTATLIRTLEEHGLKRPAAEAIASAIENSARHRPDPWMLAYAGVLTIALGWQIVALDGVRSEIDEARTAVAANGERLVRIETRLDAMETSQQEILRRLPPAN